jgi:Uma2 family endonuclease
VAASELAYELIGPYRRGKGGPGGWIILHEPEVHLGAEPDIVVPDLAGWKRETLPEVPDAAFIAVAPDWVCEVLSQSTEARDRSLKSRVYLRESVGHLWFVNPVARTLEILRLDGSSYRVVEVCTGDAKVRAEPFDATEIDLSCLWLPT